MCIELCCSGGAGAAVSMAEALAHVEVAVAVVIYQVARLDACEFANLVGAGWMRPRSASSSGVTALPGVRQALARALIAVATHASGRGRCSTTAIAWHRPTQSDIALAQRLHGVEPLRSSQSSTPNDHSRSQMATSLRSMLLVVSPSGGEVPSKCAEPAGRCA
jgi:hypothetical protein